MGLKPSATDLSMRSETSDYAKAMARRNWHADEQRSALKGRTIMPETIPIPDQDDVLATNERLTAENTRLTGELIAATELLETAQADLTRHQEGLIRAQGHRPADGTSTRSDEAARFKAGNAI